MRNRKLFYIYSYRNGMKQRNVGFVECKESGSKYRFNLSLKIPQEYIAENMSICLYKYKDGVINKLQLGTINPLNEMCKFSVAVDSNKIEDKGLSINDLSGVYIYSDEYKGYIFCTDMDGKYSIWECSRHSDLQVIDKEPVFK